MLRPLFKLILLIAAFAVSVCAQTPAKWSLASVDSGKDLASNETLKASITAAIDPGWHLYALEQAEGGPVPTTIKITEGVAFTVSGAIRSPKAIVKPDTNFIVDGKPLETRYFVDSAVFEVPLKANSPVAASALSLDVRYQLCNETFCLPPRTTRVTFAGSEDVGRGSRASTAAPAPSAGLPAPTTFSKDQPKDIWPFIWLAVTLGALSLLTPCVFPMIPITVSYFTNHAAGSRAKSVKLAAIYSLGIIGTFTILGMLLAIFVGAAGINLFAANPWINLVIAAIFLFFAFNLFGAYEITLPTSVLTGLDKLTRSKEGEGSGVFGALLMGLTFTLTSFTCTSPFVGTILVSASQGDWQMPLLGMLAFSTVFALPFFLLALAPQMLAQLPRAGGWMNSVKVAMGFLEVAAAMKFISNVDLVWKWGIFNRDVVLAVWIAIGVILSVYLLGKFQLAHDSKPERLGAFRMFSAVVSLAVSFYLLTGLFGAKLGELESFLPPDLENRSSSRRNAVDELQWISNDYPGALSRAKAENKRVFIDFTGYTCTNCRWMEANVFPQKAVEDELKKFVLVRLYTDGDGDVYAEQQQMEQDMLGTVALPYYAIASADGDLVASFPGLTRNVTEFVDFLQKAQQNYPSKALPSE
jgi:thiol:disulfide interchange protein